MATCLVLGILVVMFREAGLRILVPAIAMFFNERVLWRKAQLIIEEQGKEPWIWVRGKIAEMQNTDRTILDVDPFLSFLCFILVITERTHTCGCTVEDSASLEELLEINYQVVFQKKWLV